MVCAKPHLSACGVRGMKLGDYRRSKSDDETLAKDPPPKRSEVKSLYEQENKATERRNTQREIDSHSFQCSRFQGSYSCLLWEKERKFQTDQDLFRPEK